MKKISKILFFIMTTLFITLGIIGISLIAFVDDISKPFPDWYNIICQRSMLIILLYLSITTIAHFKGIMTFIKSELL